MDYSATPNRFNSQSAAKILSPTTAHSKQSIQQRSSAHHFGSVRSEINSIIAEVEDKKKAYDLGLSAVYNTNEELLLTLDPSRKLQAENQQLRRQLNEALREIMRLNKIILALQEENQALRSNSEYRRGCGNQLMADLQDLKKEGEHLRSNVVRLLRNK